MNSIKKSFKLKVSIVLVILILIPMVISGAIILKRDVDSINSRVFQQNMNLAKTLERQVDLSMTNANEVVDIIANFD